jgi:hypothetical protein
MIAIAMFLTLDLHCYNDTITTNCSCFVPLNFSHSSSSLLLAWHCCTLQLLLCIQLLVYHNSIHDQSCMTLSFRRKHFGISLILILDLISPFAVITPQQPIMCLLDFGPLNTNTKKTVVLIFSPTAGRLFIPIAKLCKPRQA